MKLFKRKPPHSANLRPTVSPDVGDDGNRANLTHRLTRDLIRAERLAQMLAKSRAAAVVDIADFLAGMYIYEWERLSRFWEEHDEIEELLRRICQISPQRWHRWIEFYDTSRKETEKKPGLFFSEAKKSAKKDGKPCRGSAELDLVLRNSEAIAPAPRHRERARDSYSHQRVRLALHRV